MAEAVTFRCEVCFEDCSDRLALPRLTTGNGDVLRAADCGHGVCRGCLAGYVQALVEEQRVFQVRCPHVGCRNELYEADLRRLVGTGELPATVCDKFAELRARDFTERARSFAATVAPKTDEDYCLMRVLYQSTRLCPRCSLVIQKSSGCNSFYCICGAHFNYEGAPRAIGNGIKHYGQIISMAQNLRMPLCEAEKHAGFIKSYNNASKTAMQLGLSLEEARELQARAKRGDEAARARIREGRRSAADGAPPTPVPPAAGAEAEPEAEAAAGPS